MRDDHAAYIASWIKVLKDDKRAIFAAASHAQRAADFLHGLQKSASPQADAAFGAPRRRRFGAFAEPGFHSEAGYQ